MSPNDTLTIPLSRGKMETIIDAEDYDLVISFGRWTAHPASNTFYARYTPTRIYLHRLLMGFPDGLVDHINGDTLDNRKSNLRIVNGSQSLMNTGVRSNNKSGSRGVFWDKARGKWRAEIRANGHRENLGRFECLEDAIAAYEKRSVELFGEYRRL